MIGYIKGTIEALFQDSLILDNQGIGYRIFTSGKAIEGLPGMHNEVKLFTYLHVREDELTLFGFPTIEEMDMFKLLLSVNGIGPKAALSILTVLTVQDLSVAIMSEDKKAIAKANGIGPKGAGRIIMELKDKIHLDELFAIDSDMDNEVAVSNEKADSIQDTVLALVSLGYSEFEALKAIKQIENAQYMDSEELLKLALKKVF